VERRPRDHQPQDPQDGRKGGKAEREPDPEQAVISRRERQALARRSFRQVPHAHLHPDNGSIVHGARADALFIVTNIGQGTLTGDASLSGSGAFGIVSGGTFNLGAGASQTVTVRFAPPTVGRFDTDLKLSSNGGVGEAVLSGAGK
jgi:hypothetical protein